MCTFSKTTHNEALVMQNSTFQLKGFIGHYLTGFGTAVLNAVKDIHFSQCFPT